MDDNAAQALLDKLGDSEKNCSDLRAQLDAANKATADANKRADDAAKAQADVQAKLDAANAGCCKRHTPQGLPPCTCPPPAPAKKA